MSFQADSDPLLCWRQCGAASWEPKPSLSWNSLHFHCWSNHDVQPRSSSRNDFRANPEYLLPFSKFSWGKKNNNFCCQLYENNTCILTANDLKMKSDQQCNVLGVGGGRALENPEVCISKLSSSMYLHHPQCIFPKLQPLIRSKFSTDWCFCWRAEISIISTWENLGRDLSFSVWVCLFFSKFGCYTF